MYKIYPTISTDQNCGNVCTYERRKIRVSGADKNCIITFCSILRKRLAHSYWISNSRMEINTPAEFSLSSVYTLTVCCQRLDQKHNFFPMFLISYPCSRLENLFFFFNQFVESYPKLLFFII